MLFYTVAYLYIFLCLGGVLMRPFLFFKSYFILLKGGE